MTIQFRRVLVTPITKGNKQECLTICQWFYDALVSNDIPPTCCDSFLDVVYQGVTTCRDVQLITLFLRILVQLAESITIHTTLLLENSDLPRVEDDLRKVIFGMTYLVGKGYYKDITYAIDLLYRLFMKSWSWLLLFED